MSKKELDVQYVIEKLLYDLRISRTYTGYKFVVYGLQAMMKDITLINHVYKGLYVVVGCKFGVSDKVVERDIRTIKKVVWRNNMMPEIFNGYETPPSNGEFMDLLLHEVERILREAQEEEDDEIVSVKEAICTSMWNK